MFKKLLAFVLAASFLGFLLPSPTTKSIAAENLLKTNCAIDWLPKNTTGLGIMLKNKEQLDLVLKSKAFKKLSELGATKMLVEKFNEGFNGNLEGANKEQLMEVLKVAGELFSHEVVIASGPNAPKSLSALFSAMSAGQTAPFTLMMQGNFDKDAISKAQGESIIQALVESSGDLKVPEVLLAFKLKDKKTGEGLIKRLEDKVPMVEAAEPKLKGAIKKEKVDGAEFLTIKLKGSMFPVEQIDQIAGVEEGQLKKFKADLSKLTFAAAIGIKNDYLIASMGPDLSYISSLGKGDSIASIKEFAPIAKYAGKNIIGLQYLNKEYLESVQGYTTNPEEASIQVKELIAGASLPKDIGKRVEKDVDQLIKEAFEFMPKVGARVGVTFLSDKGCESINYDYSTNMPIDGSKPLGLLQNFGGNPIFASVLRGKDVEKSWNFFSKWGAVAYGYFTEFALPNVPADQKEQVTAFLKKLEPTLAKLAKITASDLIPAMKDAQIAFVLDGKLGSKQWSAMLPKSKKDLYVPEPAFILGISDAAKFGAAIKGYREGINQIIKDAAGFDPTGTLATLKIPAPEEKALKDGKAYFYSIPMLEDVSKKLQPAAVVGENFSAITLSFEHAERLLNKTPLKSDISKLADPEKNLAGFCVFDNTALLAMINPWVEFGFEMMPPGIDEAFGVKKQVQTFFEVLGTCKGTVCSTFLENGVWVNRSISVWKDLE
ncbi:MAG: hypothetical protein ACKO16_10765 [Gemmataceae bacterium]